MQKVTGNIMNVAGLKHNDISAKTEEHKKEMELFRKKVESELFSQSLRRLKSGAKKEHTLFEKAETKSGVFGNKTLAEAAGFSSDYDVDWVCEGTGTLSQEQIRELKEKYNVEDMTKEEYEDLLKSLADMKALSDEEIKRQFICKVPPCTAMIMPDYGYSYGRDITFSGNCLMQVQKETEYAEYVLSMIQQGKCQVSPPNALGSVYAFYKKEQEYNKKIEGLLQQLQRGTTKAEDVSKIMES